MSGPWERWLEQWLAAGVIDVDTVARIREYESQHAAHPASRWPVVVAVALGGLLLSAGILLFVAAHWDQMSPFARLALINGVLLALHLGGAFTEARFPALSTTLHAAGTVALGGAIAMAGQVFHMQEHWPSGALLWALGAWAGWMQLRDWPHAVLAGLLTPVWIAGEMGESSYWRRPELIGAFVLMLSFAYMGAVYHNLRVRWRRALRTVGVIALLPAAILTVADRPSVYSYEMAGQAAIAFLVPLALSWFLRRQDAWVNAVFAAWVGVLLLLSHAQLGLGLHFWCMVGSMGLITWGLAEARPERVNLGVAGFALSVLFFYFSHLMDALGRSLSLILLGTVFLAGGWYLEMFRRKLISKIRSGQA